MDSGLLKSESKLISKTLLSIIHNKFKKFENRYDEDDVLFQSSHDYKKMKSVSLLCLAKSGFKDINLLLNAFSQLFKDNLKSSTEISIIKSLGEIGIIIKKDAKNLNKIKNYLFRFVYSEDANIVINASKYLSLLIDNNDKYYLELFIYRLKQLVYNSNLLLRYALAVACKNMLSNKIKSDELNDIIFILKKDINYLIRSKVK
jgi:hypothetical protein